MVTAEQYTALLTSTVLPTTNDLFDFQVKTLQDKGLDLRKADVNRLRKLLPEESQLFVVIPRQPDELDLNGLMALVKVKGKQGRNYLDRQYLTDLMPVSKRAHLLLNVEDGRARLNTKPSVSQTNIAAEKRIAYTVWYGIIHGIVFPCALEHHNFDLVGSRYGSDRVPYLYVDRGGVPGLDDYWYGITRPRWGAPSAGSIVGA